MQTDLGLAVTVAQVDTAVENTRAPTKEPTAGPAAPTGSTAGGAAADAGEGADEGGAAKGGSSDEGVPVFLIGIIGGGALGLCLASGEHNFKWDRQQANGYWELLPHWRIKHSL